MFFQNCTHVRLTFTLFVFFHEFTGLHSRNFHMKSFTSSVDPCSTDFHSPNKCVVIPQALVYPTVITDSPVARTPSRGQRSEHTKLGLWVRVRYIRGSAARGPRRRKDMPRGKDQPQTPCRTTFPFLFDSKGFDDLLTASQNKQILEIDTVYVFSTIPMNDLPRSRCVPGLIQFRGGAAFKVTRDTSLRMTLGDDASRRARQA